MSYMSMPVARSAGRGFQMCGNGPKWCKYFKRMVNRNFRHMFNVQLRNGLEAHSEFNPNPLRTYVDFYRLY